jgi:hypothetical protein
MLLYVPIVVAAGVSEFGISVEYVMEQVFMTPSNHLEVNNT